MFFQNLGPGWNLGNTLDAHAGGFASDAPEDHETLWGNPPASANLFEIVYDAGFRTVRIPVTWYSHLDSQHQIDEVWLERVRKVVDDALNANLYVILNAHHDEWYFPYAGNLDSAEVKLVILWRQICEAFAAYDERLIFESMNEPRLEGETTEWTGGTAEARAGVNRLNQAFVKTVRSAGGNNQGRYLLIPTYAALCIPDVVADFTLPEDTRLGVSIHLYLPTAFSLEGSQTQWSRDIVNDTELIDKSFALLHSAFVQNGTPVVLTEYGAIDSHNTEDRAAWTTYMHEKAIELGIPCIWWDNGTTRTGNPQGTFALLNRDDLTWYYPEIVQATTAGKSTP